MTKGWSRKKNLLIAIGAACLLLLGGFLVALQTELSVRTQKENTKENVRQLQALVDGAHETAGRAGKVTMRFISPRRRPLPIWP